MFKSFARSDPEIPLRDRWCLLDFIPNMDLTPFQAGRALPALSRSSTLSLYLVLASLSSLLTCFWRSLYRVISPLRKLIFLWLMMFFTDIVTQGLLLGKMEIDFLGITDSSQKVRKADTVATSSLMSLQARVNRSLLFIYLTFI